MLRNLSSLEASRMSGELGSNTSAHRRILGRQAVEQEPLDAAGRIGARALRAAQVAFARSYVLPVVPHDEAAITQPWGLRGSSIDRSELGNQHAKRRGIGFVELPPRIGSAAEDV